MWIDIDLKRVRVCVGPDDVGDWTFRCRGEMRCSGDCGLNVPCSWRGATTSSPHRQLVQRKRVGPELNSRTCIQTAPSTPNPKPHTKSAIARPNQAHIRVRGKASLVHPSHTHPRPPFCAVTPFAERKHMPLIQLQKPMCLSTFMPYAQVLRQIWGGEKSKQVFVVGETTRMRRDPVVVSPVERFIRASEVNVQSGPSRQAHRAR